MTNKPIIFKESKYSDKDLRLIKSKFKIWKTVDVYRKQLEELFEITFPQYLHKDDFKIRRNEFIKSRLNRNPHLKGNWVYYPWSGLLLHILPKAELELLLTSRNKNLINSEEQKKLSSSIIGIVGLSIGSNTATSMIHTGIGGILKLADSDDLQTSNLNRVKTGIQQVGQAKVKVTCQEIYEVNPYVDLIIYEQGLTENNIDEFVTKPKPRIVIELIDDFKMKILLRQICKKYHIPVLMFSNLGDSVLVDIERYDQDEHLPIFNGIVGKEIEEISNRNISPEDIKKYAVLLVGKENVPRKALESVNEIGRSLAGRPQLMSTVMVASGIACFLVRKIILGEPVKSGRQLIKFDEVFTNK